MDRKNSCRTTLDATRSALEINSLPVKVSFQNIKCSVKGTTILNDVTGYALPCHTHYIMGASGAGKTTLLNVLADRVPTSARVSGKVEMNDCVPLLKSGHFGKYGAYVMQDDTLYEYFTVAECLRFAARLKLGHLTKHE